MPKLRGPEQPDAVDQSILTEEERARVAAEVADEVAREAKAAALAALKEQLKQEAKRSKGGSEEHLAVTIDLAPYCDRILIDNVAYLQGMTYSVPVSRAQLMFEMMQRTWGHQSEIDGKPGNFYQKARNTR